MAQSCLLLFPGMTHEDIVQESKKYWQQMEAHASKPANSMVSRVHLGLAAWFCSQLFQHFSSRCYAWLVPGRPGWPLRRRTAESFPVCSASDDLCALFCSDVSALFSGGVKPPRQGGQCAENGASCNTLLVKPGTMATQSGVQRGPAAL